MGGEKKEQGRDISITISTATATAHSGGEKKKANDASTQRKKEANDISTHI